MYKENKGETMQYIVKEIKMNLSGKGPKGTYYFNEITLSGGGKDVTKRIFDKTDLAKVLKGISQGDTVNAEFDDSTYKNLISLDVVKAPVKEDKKYTSNYGQDSEEKKISIARAVALKAATELVVASLNKDMYKKTVTAEFLVNEILERSRGFEAYLLINDIVDGVATSEGAGDFEQDPF